MIPWSDTNRFSQTGYSAPTIFPQVQNYVDIAAWIEDYTKAVARQNSHLEWVWEERQEARIEYLEQQAETKAERDLHDY